MTKQLHIAQFTNTYHPVVSGVVRSISTFRQSLTELGHLTFIFAQYAAEYQDTEPFVFRYPGLDIPISQDFPISIPTSSFVDKLLPSLKLDVIHSHHPFLLGHSGMRQATELHLPHVFTFHTRYRDYSHYVPLNQDIVKSTIDHLIGDFLRQCQHIVVPSESMRQILADEYGAAEFVTVIPTGIDLTPYQAADRQAIRQKLGWGQQKILISISRLAKEKNWPVLLAGAAQVMKKDPTVRLVIIGEGDERKSLEQYAKECGVADRVTFTGQLAYDEVPRYLKAADIFCFASVTETQGLVTMEAMAAGLPVVAVDATGTRDAVTHGKEGLLTPNNAYGLAKALDQVLNDEALRNRFQVASVQKAKTFDAIHLAKKLVSVYEQAIEDKRAGRTVPVERHQPMFELVKDQWHKLIH